MIYAKTVVPGILFVGMSILHIIIILVHVSWCMYLVCRGAHGDEEGLSRTEPRTAGKNK